MQLGQRSGAAHRQRGLGPLTSPRDQEERVRSRDLRAQLQERVDAMAMRLGQVNAHVIRLDALGKRLTEMANIDHREFDFDSAPPDRRPGDREGVSAADPRPHQHARHASSDAWTCAMRSSPRSRT